MAISTEDLSWRGYEKTDNFFSLSDSEKKGSYIQTTRAAIADKMYQRPDGNWFCVVLGQGDYQKQRNFKNEELELTSASFWFRPDIEIDGVLMPGDWRDQFDGWDESHPEYDFCTVLDCDGNIRKIRTEKGWSPRQTYTILWQQ